MTLAPKNFKLSEDDRGRLARLRLAYGLKTDTDVFRRLLIDAIAGLKKQPTVVRARDAATPQIGPVRAEPGARLKGAQPKKRAR